MNYNEYMMESVCSALDDLVESGSLTESQADEVYDLAYEKYVCESFGKYNVEKYKDKISKIRKMDISSLSKDEKELKKFIDENGAEIEYCLKALEDEKIAIKKDKVPFILSMIGSFLVLPIVGWVILGVTHRIIKTNRKKDTDITKDDLIKIREKLDKLSDSKIRPEYRKEIANLIKAIDDMD